MICSSCGTENRADRKFWLRCGTALAATCPSCGAANEPEAGFCGECGRPLGSGPGDAALRGLGPEVQARVGDQAALLPPTPTTTAGAAEARRRFEDLGAAGLLAHLERLGVAAAGTERQVRSRAAEPVK